MESVLMSAGRHMQDDEVENYCLREMTDVNNAPFEEHLLTCEDCRNRVLETDRYISAMYHAGNEIRSASQKRPAWAWSFATAAALAVVLVAVFLMRAPEDTVFQEVHLYAMRGVAGSARVTAEHPMTLIPDLTGLPEFPSYRLSVVDAGGKPVFSGEVEAAAPAIKVKSVPSGIYFVRLSSPDGELLREYGLESAR